MSAPLFDAAAVLGRAPTAPELDAMQAQAGRLGALYANRLLPARVEVEGSPGLFVVTAEDLVPVLPWEGQP
jgi:hypothetical protein